MTTCIIAFVYVSYVVYVSLIKKKAAFFKTAARLENVKDEKRLLSPESFNKVKPRTET